MIGDLHLNSSLSDGHLEVPEILLRAKERGLSYVSIADLHSTASTAVAMRDGFRIGLTVVPGVEIIARSPVANGEVHILGYGYDMPATNINRLCDERRDIAEGSVDDADRAPGGLPAAVEVIDAIHADGGYAVLAHPGQLDSYGAVDSLVDLGLDGIELYHPDHGPDDHRRTRDLADRHGLFVTGGSDGAGSLAGTHDIGDIRAPFGSLAFVLRHDDELVEWVESLVREAGRMARRAVMSEIDTELKGGDISDIVTEHDKAIDRFLTDAIRSRFPDHDFVTEEHDHPPVDGDTPTWIIDPIDGTTNFVSTGDCFAVSLAFYRGSRPVLGFVYDVMSDDLYLGISGRGAYLNGRPLLVGQGGGGEQVKPLADSVIECSFVCSQKLARRFNAQVDEMTKAFRAQRSYGSAAIGICRIARGSLDVYLSCSLSLWDYAAACIVLAEAGGVTFIEDRRDDSDGPGIRFHGDRRVVLCAGSAGAADEVLDLLFTTERPSMTALQLEISPPSD